MARRPDDFRILDKDLARHSSGIFASSHVAGKWQRLGIGLIFVLLAGMLGLTLAGAATATATIIGGLALTGWLALVIGGNDVSNAIGATYGARAMGLWAGLLMASVATIAGGLLAGHNVTLTLVDGILTLPTEGAIAAFEPARTMLAALAGAVIWISFSTWVRAPVSTTHSVIGGIGGAALMITGPEAINWPVIAWIGAGWVVSPVVSGLLAATFMAALYRFIHSTPDRLEALRQRMPVVIGLVVTLSAWVSLAPLGGPIMPISIALGLAIAISMRGALNAMVLGEQGPDRKRMGRLLHPPLIIAAALSAFAHGANDIGNVAGPLTVLLRTSPPGVTTNAMTAGVLGLAAFGIGLGILLFGRRLVQLVGDGITRLNPTRSLCVTVATAITVMTATRLGIPLSVTHVTIGAIFGVGFYREWHDSRRGKTRAAFPKEERRRRALVRRNHLAGILAAWAVTLPMSGLIAALAAITLSALG